MISFFVSAESTKNSHQIIESISFKGKSSLALWLAVHSTQSRVCIPKYTVALFKVLQYALVTPSLIHSLTVDVGCVAFEGVDFGCDAFAGVDFGCAAFAGVDFVCAASAGVDT